MSHIGKSIRLNRLLQPERATLVVAFDHPLVHGPIPGTLFPEQQIRSFAENGAEAILVNLGMVGGFARLSALPRKPCLIARLDWTTAFTAGKDPTAFQSCMVAHPEEALHLGADAVITFLCIGSGNPQFEREEMSRTGRVARECERAGIPLIVESIARGREVQNPQDPTWLLKHTRIAAELGADAIKTEYTGNPETMRAVVEACPIPLLVLGGSRLDSDDEVVEVVRGIVRAGAAGLFFGRNLFQAQNMPELFRKIRSVLIETKI
jgi:fructose-bisphosphate aldolase/2-amino-3,7-dideoxy-D-threo-hept-6-ulosonate synthase